MVGLAEAVGARERLMRRALTVQLCVSCVDAALMSARAAVCPSREYPQLTLCPATSAQGGGGAADGRQEIHEKFIARRRALTTQRLRMRYETRPAPARLPLPPTHTDPQGARAMPISTTITASDLGALFSSPRLLSTGRPPRRWDRPGVHPDRASRTTPTPPVRPTRRGRVASRTHADFDGGAYPEIDVVQPPQVSAGARTHPRRTTRTGRGHPPRRAGRQFRHQICAARRALRLDRDSSVSSADARRARTITPASNHRRVRHRHRLFRALFRSENEMNTRARDGTFGGSIGASSARTRTRSSTRTRTRARHFACAMSSRTPSLDSSSNPAHGVPTIVSDAGRVGAGGRWGFDGLAAARHEMVTCNDRAPARRADATSAHGKQRTCALPVREYLSTRGTTGERSGRMARRTPVLLKRVARVRASEASEASGSVASRAFPPPYFTSAMDHTRAIAERRIVGCYLAPAGSGAAADGLDAALGKMFVGPAGTVTRMHQDAGEAHAWLAQVIGRKLLCVARRTTLRAPRHRGRDRRRRNRRWTDLAGAASPRRNLDRDAPRRVHARTGGGGGDSARLALRGRHRSRVDGDAQLFYHAGRTRRRARRRGGSTESARGGVMVHPYFGKADGCSSPRVRLSSRSSRSSHLQL